MNRIQWLARCMDALYEAPMNPDEEAAHWSAVAEQRARDEGTKDLFDGGASDAEGED